MIALFIRGSNLYEEWIEEYQKTRNSDEEFISNELLISAVVGSIYNDYADIILENFQPLFDGEIDLLDEIIELSKPIASNIIPDGSELEQELFDQMLNVLTKGENLAGYPNALNGHYSKQRILDGMTKSSKYYTNNYFNNRVLPALNKDIQNQINDPDLILDPEFFQGLQKRMNRRLKDVPYWRVVNNAALSRTYTYGTLKAAQLNGKTGYRFWNPMDDITSPICRFYNGEEYWIADALQKIDSIAEADNPEDVKNIDPWYSMKNIEGMSKQDILTEYGVPTPPMHGNCRSLLIPI